MKARVHFARGWEQAMQQRQAALGIIGGSGLYSLGSLTNVEVVEVETPWGKPSEPMRIGEIGGQTVAFLSRHGAGHRLTPSEIPYAANVCAMKMIGVSRLVSISAVGSLREDYPPRSFVVPDGTIDRTLGRQRSFFDRGIVAHVSIADPFCPDLSSVLAGVASSGGLPVNAGGTYIAIEGPQFSTRAESALFRSWGASVIGMTAMPEARLAREAELCYACLAMVTDYDVWHEQDGPVTVDAVLANLHAMTDAVQTIVTALAAEALPECRAGCGSALANAIATSLGAIDDATRERLEPIAGRYLEPGHTA
ncbi:MAG TPA: S-methyl-5'-thioadenosine phosphorylase [Thermomicrobiales bacterium]|nr:S-methyl-5'-thioadenosine phosphorylase [Thermomicrobiales bacterium]